MKKERTKNSKKARKRGNSLALQPNTFQRASVPSCVLLLSTQLRNSMRPERKGTARVKTFHSPKQHWQNKKNGPGGEQTEVKTNSDPSKGCQISHATYKYFHGHNIAASRNGNHTSNRWDFHSIPKLIFASFLAWLQPCPGSTLHM